jgi:lysozyme family protein
LVIITWIQFKHLLTIVSILSLLRGAGVACLVHTQEVEGSNPSAAIYRPSRLGLGGRFKFLIWMHMSKEVKSLSEAKPVSLAKPPIRTPFDHNLYVECFEEIVKKGAFESKQSEEIDSLYEKKAVEKGLPILWTNQDMQVVTTGLKGNWDTKISDSENNVVFEQSTQFSISNEIPLFDEKDLEVFTTHLPRTDEALFGFGASFKPDFSLYEKRFGDCNIIPARRAAVAAVANRMVANKARYQAVSAKTTVPWYIIAVIHNMECSGRFNAHLHNGDPLNHKTIHVPANRPSGNAPFTWEESAIDALTFTKTNKWRDWSISGALYRLELYNGMGYQKRGVPSPYLWSFSNQYTKGKYVADGKYDPNAVSSQVGAAVILHYMRYERIINFPQ